MELQGKNVLITGSTRGIGWGLAEAFAKEGCNIVLNGRGTIESTLIAQIEALGVTCVGVSGDIADFDTAGEIVKEVEAKLGPVDILINNAGITNDKLVLRMTGEDFQKVVDINLGGTFNMTQHVLKKMMKQRAGAIINMASVSGLMGNLGQANYAASKAGVVGFTKSVAREAAARGITVNAIAPGFIETDMTDCLSDKVKEAATANIPLQRFGQVAEVAQAAIFLAQHPYITGQVLNVDGGMVMQG